MPKIYIEVPIAERMPVIGEKARQTNKIVLIDKCNVKHVFSERRILGYGRIPLLELGYVSWLEEVEVSVDVLELVKGGASCK